MALNDPSESTSLLRGSSVGPTTASTVIPVLGSKPEPWTLNYFGPKPEHPKTTREENADVLSRLDYGWIGYMINRAKSGDLKRGLTMPISECDKTWTVGTALYKFFGLQRAAAATWDSYVDSSRESFRLKKDPNSRGTLRYVGKVQTAKDGDKKFYVAIEWTELPKSYSTSDNTAASRDGSSANGDDKGPRFLHNGAYKGEKLFNMETLGGYATLEDPDALELVPLRDGDDRDGSTATPKPPVLAWALFKTVQTSMTFSIIPRFTYECCYLVAPIVLQQYVDYLEDPDRQWEHGMMLAGIFFFINIGQSLSFQKHFHLCMRAGLNLRSALMAQIVHKAITVSKKATSHPDLTSGKIINLMSSDVEHINVALGFVNYIWSSPLQIIVAVSLLYRMVGWIAFASVAVTIVVIPLQGMVMKMQVGARTDFSAATDKRVKATNELFNSVYIVKCMGWEESFRKNVLHLRDLELAQLKRIQTFRVLSSFMTAASPMLVMATCFTLYHVTGHTLTPRIVFPVIALLNILQAPFALIPMVFNFGIMAMVATRRLSSFLAADDNENPVSSLNLPHSSENMNSSIGGTPNKDNNAISPISTTVTKGHHEDGDFDIVFDKANIAAFSSQEIKQRTAANGTVTPQPEASPKDNSSKKKDEKKFQVVEKTLLHDISIKIPRKKFTVIVGATGSGKTTLLESLLGELKLQTGSITANKSIAFVPQQAWVMNATVRENITFFDDFDQRRFDAAVDSCQLAVDLTQFARAEMTEIGEKGVSLSGGQKARINLARAVYANREVYLMDDPLSAVDAHVSKKLVEDCFKCTLGDTTRVLVTHQTHVIAHADHVIALKDGRVEFQGTAHEYHQFQRDHGEEVDDSDEESEETRNEADASCKRRKKKAAGEIPETEEEKKIKEAQEKKKTEKKEGEGMSVEEKAEGSVGLDIYGKYLVACGGKFKFFLLFLWFVLTECVNASTSLWLSFWSTGAFNLERNTYLYVYLAIIACAAGNSASRAYLMYGFGRHGSLAMHEGMLRTVSAARMSFFDTTPLGRINNRFAKDIDSIDNELPMNFLSMMSTGFAITSSSIVMAVSQPFVILAMIPAGIVYSRVMKFFNAANREVKRVDNINKSPVFAILGEVLEGSKSISAFHKAAPLMKEVLYRIDCCFSSSYLQQVCNRWLGFRLEFLGNIIITSIAGLGVFTTATGLIPLNVGMISLGMTLAMSITQQMNWLVRGTATVEAGMNSVERILHYTTGIDIEDFSWYGEKPSSSYEAASNPLIAVKSNPIPRIPLPGHLHKNSDNGPAVSSSAAGRTNSTTEPTSAQDLSIEFKDVELKYRPALPLVLKGASFIIPPKNKVGIVGRSGSGKSTTLQAFLRIVDISGGEILIGGKPIGSFALDHLRSLFALIPQDPVLFAGTVKNNVDPFSQHTNQEIMDAIKKVGLEDRVMQREDGDDEGENTGVHCAVAQGGSNFSVGQRQLMCMARALLKQDTGFILMDEATANIDPAADHLIQQTIRTAFNKFTVITIAHRLETVIDSDLIIVMDAGKTAEVGSPSSLLEQEGGIFKGMVDVLSPEQQTKLKAMADRRGAASTTPPPTE